MLQVRDLMQAQVTSVGPELSLRDLVEELARTHVSGVPVLEGRRPIGVVSASDVLSFLASLPAVPSEQSDFLEQGEVTPPGEWEEGEEAPSAFFTEFWDDVGADLTERFQRIAGPEWDVLEEHTVAEAMTRVVATLSADADVTAAARYLIDQGIHRVLVIDGGNLEGILTTTDLVRAIADGRLAPAVAGTSL